MPLLLLLGGLWKSASASHIPLYIGLGAALFFAGFTWGQQSVTARAVTAAVETVQTHADQQFAAATSALAAEHTEINHELQAEAMRARVADDTATASIEAGVKSATADRAAALKQLAAERTARLRMETAHVIPPSCPAPVPFSFSGATRLLLDKAAAAGGAVPLDPADRDSASTTAGGAAPSPATTAGAAAAGRVGP